MNKSNFIFNNNTQAFIIFILFIYSFIYMTGQLSTPYIRHDDWEYMTYLLPDMPHHGTPLDKTLWEGRWVNYLWSFIARDFLVNTNYLLFIIGYSLFCWTIGMSFATGIFSRFLISLIAFFCPAYVDLSFWPATLTPSVWIAFFLLLFNYFCKNKLYIFPIMITFAILIMSYAPLISVCFLLLTLDSRRTVNDNIKLSITYYVGYLLGVIFVYILNYKYHGFLGVKIADWRNPNPIHSFDNVIENTQKTIFFFKDLISNNIGSILISSILMILLFNEGHKKQVITFIGSMFLVISLESALSIYTGVDIPDRSLIWPWYFFLSVIILTFRFASTVKLILATVLILTLLYTGMERWYGFYTYESKHARFENVLGGILKTQDQEQVYICGDTKNIKGLGNRELKALTLSIWKKDGIYLKQADEKECSLLSDKSLGLHKINEKTFYKLY